MTGTAKAANKGQAEPHSVPLPEWLTVVNTEFAAHCMQ